MISKLRFSLVAVMLLVLLGFGFQNQAKGQPGEDNQFCPGVPFTNGWLETDIVRISKGGSPIANFSGALLGTVESFGGAAVGGLDWQHVDTTFDGAFGDNPTPTNEVGSQLISWWSQKDGRNTYLQITNTNGGTQTDIFGTPFVPIHVRILDENCVEIRNFCDTLTGIDTHVYDFGNLVDNEGDDIPDSNLQGKEGFVVITAVTDGCPGSDLAVEYNWLSGTMYMLDPNDYLYGINTYARWGVCFDEPFDVPFNLIGNGSFQNGNDPDPFGPWSIEQGALFGNTGPVTATEFAPPIPVPVCNDPDNPDCLDPDADIFMGVVFSDSSIPSGFYGETSPMGSAADLLQTPTLIGAGVTETNVTIIESNVFTPSMDAVGNVVLYDTMFLAPNDVLWFCDNYAAAILIDVTDPMAPTQVDIECSNRTGGGICFVTGDDANIYAFGSFEFQGGRSGIQSGALGNTTTGRSYLVQLVSGQTTEIGCTNSGFPRATTGGLFDNVRFIEIVEFDDECDGILTGAFNAYLADVIPNQFAGQFNVQDTTAGADAVMINFADEYFPAYKPLAAFVNAELQIWDEFEVPASCGAIDVCFVRLGVDANIIISEDFPFVSPSPSPGTPSPSPSPGTPSPSPSPSPSGNGGSSSGCAIAGNPVQLGTAMANVLIPLIPVAFVFGVRAIRRRKK